jgi:hypothetical protein
VIDHLNIRHALRKWGLSNGQRLRVQWTLVLLSLPIRMSLRKELEGWQIGWAERHGIRIRVPPGNIGSRAKGYVSELEQNLFEPLLGRVKRQFIAGAGGELDEPHGQSGNMYAVYSSSALCINLFTPGPGFLTLRHHSQSP